MSKKIAAIATLIVALAAMPAYAAKGGGKSGGGSATSSPPIALDQPAPVTVPQVTFTVTRSSVQIGVALWVRNDCYDAAGNHLTGNISIVYFDPTSPGNSIGTTDPFSVAGVSCTAFVTDSPGSGHPISKDAQITYAVA